MASDYAESLTGKLLAILLDQHSGPFSGFEGRASEGILNAVLDDNETQAKLASAIDAQYGDVVGALKATNDVDPIDWCSALTHWAKPVLNVRWDEEEDPESVSDAIANVEIMVKNARAALAKLTGEPHGE